MATATLAEQARKKLDLSKYHERLIDVCFKIVPPRPLKVNKLPDRLDMAALEAMSSMVEHELLTGLEKERKGPDDADAAALSAAARWDPFPFDVCLMEASLEQRASHNLSVCLPHKGELFWYDGDASIHKLDERGYKWRVASIAGLARILEALDPGNVHKLPLVRAAMERKSIVDAVEDTSALEALHGKVVAKLNQPQRRAVATVLDPSFTNGFFCVQGPPGTGKSTVITAMIAVMGSGVLVSAPSNAAVANVAVKTFVDLRDRFNLLDIVVFGENCDPTAHFLSPRFRGEKFEAFVKEYEGTKSIPRANQLKRDFVQWLHLDDSAMEYTISELRQLCPYVDTSEQAGRRKLAILLSQAKIVFSTLNSAGSWTLRQNLSAHTILLDEAGQCPEAEFYIAATVPGVRRVVVIGDPKQLPSTVVDPACQKAGYGVSWLGKVHEIMPHAVHLLSLQYRMDPFILEFPNKQFYDGRVNSASCVFDRVRAQHPFRFVDTCGYGREEMVAYSWSNAYDIATIQHLLVSDPDVKQIKDDLFQRNVVPRFMVIAPYKAQVSLLKERLRAPRDCTLFIATADSCQGQEAHIVIFSTVRTHRVGFVDSPERINVALTRSISILRIVGDLQFFLSLEPGSTLRKLASFAKRQETERVAVFNVRPVRWSPPNWDVRLVWDVCFSARFRDCLKHRSAQDQNVFMNTLYAIASADVTALHAPLPSRAAPSWYMSALKGSDQYQVVWMASMKGSNQTITAEYAGTRNECLRFIQLNHCPPREACVVRSCLSGVESLPAVVEQKHDNVRSSLSSHLFWKVTNATQHAVASGVSLPLEGVQLDPAQEAVARTAPPLLIESRSGTGKTLVLVQHAAYFTHHDDASDSLAACFVTVSSRLCAQLEKKYDELNRLENLRLPPTLFFSFRDLLERLLQIRNIVEFNSMHACTYMSYEHARKSHERVLVDSHLVESEIGGVITGSLVAATQKCPLSRTQYLNELRSNVANDPTVRSRIYDCFLEYRKWKIESNRFDMGDVVLRLLGEDWEQLFSSAYLDEIQDLSYAAVKRLCTVGGRESAMWVCAGDPAQMISPGCSFTFDGLKQTLRSLNPGIDNRLSNVTQLLVNYRTSQDVLQLGNEVLSIAKKNFPNQIPFSREETAKKDLGIRVVLCRWRTALKAAVRPGTEQAVIYSSSDPDRMKEKLRIWIDDHPFTLSTLESKGLEFDDVLVAFQFDRKTWNVCSTRISCLNMLRELYVAVTRAKRRVVILLDDDAPEMAKFFRELSYDFQENNVELVLSEFNKVTTQEEWFQTGSDLCEQEHYEMAYRCFHKAGDMGWYHFARGRSYLVSDLADAASKEFEDAIVCFAAELKHDLVLRVGLRLAKLSVGQNFEVSESVAHLIEASLLAVPQQLGDTDRIELALATKNWKAISVEDLKKESLASVFLQYGDSPSLREKLSSANEDDLRAIEPVLPAVIGRLYMDLNDIAGGIRAYLHCEDVSHAVTATARAVDEARSGALQCSCIRQIVELWNASARSCESSYEVTKLIDLFNSPSNAAASRLDWVRLYGRHVIVEAVDADADVDRTLLYDFDADAFASEVIEALNHRFDSDPRKIFNWFLVEKGCARRALAYAEKRLKMWSADDFVGFLTLFASLSAPALVKIYEEMERRKLLSRVVLKIIASPEISLSIKTSIAEKVAKHKKVQDASSGLIVTTTWCLDDSLSQWSPRRKGAGSSKSKKGRGSSSDQASQFASSLMSTWQNDPLISKRKESKHVSADTSGTPVSQADCVCILDSILESVDKEAKNDILHACDRLNKGQDASTSLLELAWKHCCFTFALDIADCCLKSSATSKGLNLSLLLRSLTKSSIDDVRKSDEADKMKLEIQFRWCSILIDVALRLDTYEALMPSLKAVPEVALKHALSLLWKKGVRSTTLACRLTDSGCYDFALLVSAYALQMGNDALAVLRFWAAPGSLSGSTPELLHFHGSDDMLNFLSILLHHLRGGQASAYRQSSIECLPPSSSNVYSLVRAFGPVLIRFVRLFGTRRLASEEAESCFQMVRKFSVDLNLALAKGRRKIEATLRAPVDLKAGPSRRPSVASIKAPQVPLANNDGTSSGLAFGDGDCRQFDGEPQSGVRPAKKSQSKKKTGKRNRKKNR